MGFSGADTVTTANAYKRIYLGWLPDEAVYFLNCEAGTCAQTIDILDLQMYSPGSLGANDYMAVKMQRLANLGGHYFLSYRNGSVSWPDGALI